MSPNPNRRAVSSLSDPQQRNLGNACKHMDGLLKDIESALNPTHTRSVFPKYVNDVAPMQRKTIERYLARFRSHLINVLADHAIQVEPPRVKASFAIHTSLTFIEIAIEELSPGRMRGYGPVSDSGAAALEAVMQDLQSIVMELHRYVLETSDHLQRARQ